MILIEAEYCHTDLNIWNKSLLFYADILRVFERRLTEVIQKNSNRDVLAGAEHFQNQFIVQKEQFDILRHEIHEQEVQLKQGFLKGVDSLPATTAGQQLALKDKMHTTEEIFDQTKKDFYHFLSRIF